MVMQVIWKFDLLYTTIDGKLRARSQLLVSLLCVDDRLLVRQNTFR